ncbi:unnamed protein product, partial [Mesorhabditis spiculigera]
MSCDGMDGKPLEVLETASVEKDDQVPVELTQTDESGMADEKLPPSVDVKDDLVAKGQTNEQPVDVNEDDLLNTSLNASYTTVAEEAADLSSINDVISEEPVVKTVSSEDKSTEKKPQPRTGGITTGELAYLTRQPDEADPHGLNTEVLVVHKGQWEQLFTACAERDNSVCVNMVRLRNFLEHFPARAATKFVHKVPLKDWKAGKFVKGTHRGHFFAKKTMLRGFLLDENFTKALEKREPAASGSPTKDAKAVAVPKNAQIQPAKRNRHKKNNNSKAAPNVDTSPKKTPAPNNKAEASGNNSAGSSKDRNPKENKAQKITSAEKPNKPNKPQAATNRPAQTQKQQAEAGKGKQSSEMRASFPKKRQGSDRAVGGNRYAEQHKQQRHNDVRDSRPGSAFNDNYQGLAKRPRVWETPFGGRPSADFLDVMRQPFQNAPFAGNISGSRYAGIAGFNSNMNLSGFGGPLGFQGGSRQEDYNQTLHQMQRVEVEIEDIRRRKQQFASSFNAFNSSGQYYGQAAPAPPAPVDPYALGYSAGPSNHRYNFGA